MTQEEYMKDLFRSESGKTPDERSLIREYQNLAYRLEDYAHLKDTSVIVKLSASMDYSLWAMRNPEESRNWKSVDSRRAWCEFSDL